MPDLRIKNYRLFKEFEVERLARVSLIAGGNNTGKSSLLEAAYLVASEDIPSALGDVLRIQGENDKKSIIFPLFYGYRLSPGAAVEISSGKEDVKFSIPDREEMERLLEESTRPGIVPGRLSERARPYEYGDEGPVLLLQMDRSGSRPWHFVLQGEEGAIDGRGLQIHIAAVRGQAEAGLPARGRCFLVQQEQV